MNDRLLPLALSVVLGLALAGTALAAAAQDARLRRTAWALSGLFVGGILLLALGSQAHNREPGIVILCESGGVYRAEDGGFLASGGPASCMTGRAVTPPPT